MDEVGTHRQWPQKKKFRRSRHWNEIETKVLITKWSEDNITRKIEIVYEKESYLGGNFQVFECI